MTNQNSLKQEKTKFCHIFLLKALANPSIYQMGAGCYLSVVYIVSNRQLSDLNPNSYQTAPYFYGQISDFS